MALEDDLKTYVANTFKSVWTTRKGQVVPIDTDIALKNDGVYLDATCLYADMAGSTDLVDNYKAEFATEIYKSFLYCAAKMILHHSGSVTAFDGDRVMGVFIGDTKNTNAAKCALRINYAVSKIINPSIKTYYPKTDYTVKHAVGVDTSRLLVARTGVRGSNDLIWVGRAGNYAAAMSSFREGNYVSFITKDVFDKMKNEAKISKDNRPMWEERRWAEKDIVVYRSSWHWGP